VSQQSLLDELGLDEQTLTWRQLALCGGRNGEGMDINLFFDDYEDDKDLAVSMDEVCLSCPVMKDFLFEAQRKKDYGLRGAIYLNNGKPDRQANSHKTNEVWERIEDRLRS
jgi:hypothetical protein